MGKSSRKMFSTIYENDILSLDTLEELKNTVPLKSNRAIKQAKKESKLKSKTNSPQPSITPTTTKASVATKPVNATCNKCGHKITGILVGDIYINGIEKMVPLITYTCEDCGHVGRRSVITLALPVEEYERKYFV